MGWSQSPLPGGQATGLHWRQRPSSCPTGAIARRNCPSAALRVLSFVSKASKLPMLAAERPFLGMTKESQLDHMGDASSLSCLGELGGEAWPFDSLSSRRGDPSLGALTSDQRPVQCCINACPRVCWQAHQCIRDTVDSLARQL